jgi:hypothetical protein
MADDQGQQVVGKCRIAGQYGPMQVGADEAVMVRTVGAVTVSDPDERTGQRAYARAAAGEALMVLKARE